MKNLYAPANFDPSKVEVVRKRFSVTQGETLIAYNGQRIEQYGDDPAMCADGVYRQKPRDYWVAVAMSEALTRGWLQ